MNWKNKLIELGQSGDYKLGLELIEKTIDENPHNIEAYVNGIYFIHDVLLEKDYLQVDHDYLSGLLNYYFSHSYHKFSNNAEYLFFVGKILYVAEWYFGLNDDLKPMEEKKAFKMQKKAHELDKENLLYEWAMRFSLGDKLAVHLARQILQFDTMTVEWLKSKGFPGHYILASLKRNVEE